MSLGDIAQALALAEKGFLSPDSFRKVVSRVVHDTEEASGKNEEKVCLAWVYRLRNPLFFFSQASAPATSSSGSSIASGKRSGGSHAGAVKTGSEPKRRKGNAATLGAFGFQMSERCSFRTRGRHAHVASGRRLHRL